MGKQQTKRSVQNENKKTIETQKRLVVMPTSQISVNNIMGNLEEEKEISTTTSTTGVRLQPNVNFLGRVLSSLERSNAMQLVAEVEPLTSAINSSTTSSSEPCFGGESRRGEGIALIERIAGIYGIQVQIIDKDGSENLAKNQTDCRSIIQDSQVSAKASRIERTSEKPKQINQNCTNSLSVNVNNEIQLKRKRNDSNLGRLFAQSLQRLNPASHPKNVKTVESSSNVSVVADGSPDETASETVNETVRETVNETVSETVDETVNENQSTSISTFTPTSVLTKHNIPKKEQESMTSTDTTISVLATQLPSNVKQCEQKTSIQTLKPDRTPSTQRQRQVRGRASILLKAIQATTR